MNPTDVLRMVEQIHRQRNLPRETVFKVLEEALLYAARKHFGDEKGDLTVQIDRRTGQIIARHGQEEISPEVLGRIAAQTAKQVLTQRIREAESAHIYEEYSAQKGNIVQGMVTRREEGGRGSGGYVVTLGGQVEAFLPASRVIPHEQFRTGDRIKAIVEEVRKEGGRVRIILSRTHNDFVRRLFEQEIPEVADHTVEIKAIARKPGKRCKVAVVSNDARVEPTGACIGVRGARIKNIIEQLSGEHIDVVRWNASPEVFVKEALQPAQVDEVLLFQQLGRATALVRQDELKKAIGKEGHNVRLASLLTGWDIEVMTQEELSETIQKAEEIFQNIPNLSAEQVARLVSDGFWSFNDLSCAEPEYLANLLEVPVEQAEEIIAYAEERASQEEEQPRRVPAATPSPPAAETPAIGAEETTAATPEPTPATGPTEQAAVSEETAGTTPQSAASSTPETEPAQVTSSPTEEGSVTSTPTSTAPQETATDIAQTMNESVAANASQPADAWHEQG